MKELLSGLIGPVTGIINKVVPDKDEAARLAHEISTMADRHAQALAVAQIEVNRAEAAGNWFQASWRPLCGYVCVLGLAVNFLISPIAAGFGFVVPQADMSTRHCQNKPPCPTACWILASGPCPIQYPFAISKPAP